MRRAIEKLTFFVLSLALSSLVTFALFARLTNRAGSEPASLPLLVNTHPHDSRDLTLAAVREAAAGGRSAEHARGELARLGGAALPHVLPALESLDPAARGRVALALAPIARRMGVGGDDDFATPERAVVFFTRFWQDRSADFRAAAVRRKVERLAERALPLRRKEVIELDTFALPELLDALGRVQTADDVKRVERLSPVLAHITGVEFPLPEGPTVAEAARTATAWRDWAFDQGSDFVTLDGPGRLAAMVLQTRYFHFLAAMPRAVRGDDPEGSARLAEVLARARGSVPFVALSLVLAVALSTLLGRWLAFRERLERHVARGALLVAALPLAALGRRGVALGTAGLVASLVLGLTALLVLELQSPRRIDGRLRRAAARAGTLLPVTLASFIGAEAVLGRGLGLLAVDALRTNDLEALMWIGAVLSVTGSVAILLPDPAPPRRLRAESPRSIVPARPHARSVAALLGLLACFVLAALLRPAGTTAGTQLVHAAAMTLVTTGIATLTAAFVAFTLGVLAGGISRAADIALSRLLELSCALPQPLVACATFTFGSVIGAVLLGALRGVEVGHWLRLHLVERRIAEQLEPPGLGRAPLSPYLRRVLPAAVAPAMTSLALTAAWIATLEGAGAELGAPTSASLAALSVAPGGLGLAAFGLVTLLGAALSLLGRDLSPRERSDETPGMPLVLPLRRRIDSTRPPSAASGEGRPSR
jgi:hypothetical protein